MILLLLWGNLGVLLAYEGSKFIKQEVPEANLDLKEESDFIDSAAQCGMICMGNNVNGKECHVFYYENTTLSCFLGGFRQIDRSHENNSTKLVFKIQGCVPPENPENGRWYCEKNVKQEKCFLVCTPGYVPQSYRGLYCIFNGNIPKWERSIDEFKCVPSVIAISGGWNQYSQLRTFDLVRGLVVHSTNQHYFRVHVLEFFRGYTTYCGGTWYPGSCGYYDFALGSKINMQAVLNPGRYDSSSAIVQDRYYIIGGSYNQGTSTYLQEADDIAHVGPLTPELTSAYSCTTRFSDTSFIKIGKKSVIEYNIITGIAKELPSLNIAREKFGCDSYLDEDGEEVFIVAGGIAADAKKSSEIFKPSTGNWTMIGNLTFGRSWHSVVTTTEGVFVIGGEGTVKQVEKLDMKNKTWVDTGLVIDPNHAFAATAIPANIFPP